MFFRGKKMMQQTLKLQVPEALDAIENRISRRSYTGALPNDATTALREVCERFNRQGSLSLRLMQEGGTLFNGFAQSYGMFSGVRSFFVMAGSASDPHLAEKVGVYGEKLILYATHMGFGTCWVGGSFDRQTLSSVFTPDKRLVCVITIGPVHEDPGMKEQILRHFNRRNTKPLDALYTADETPPDWFMRGVRAVAIGPSTLNRMPVHFTYKNGQVIARVPEETEDNLVDLGIAKLHFALAAGGGFPLGDGAVFQKE